MRIGKVLLALAITALALLCLSALVVYTPAETDGATPPTPDQPMRATLVPLALPAADGAGALAQREPISRHFAILVILAVSCALPTLLRRDANGRVLCARRYENSFYQVFRPEVAGG